MTPERLREIAALCEAATPGPWRWGDWRADFGLIESEFRCTLEYSPEHGAFDGPVKRHRDEGGERVLSVEDDVENPADKRLIAASRTAIPELLAEVARLRTDLAETNLVLEQQDRDLEKLRSDLDHATSHDGDHLSKASRRMVDTVMGDREALRAKVRERDARIAALETGLREACRYIDPAYCDDGTTTPTKDRLLALANNTTKETP